MVEAPASLEAVSHNLVYRNFHWNFSHPSPFLFKMKGEKSRHLSFGIEIRGFLVRDPSSWHLTCRHDKTSETGAQSFSQRNTDTHNVVWGNAGGVASIHHRTADAPRPWSTHDRGRPADQRPFLAPDASAALQAPQEPPQFRAQGFSAGSFTGASTVALKRSRWSCEMRCYIELKEEKCCPYGRDCLAFCS